MREQRARAPASGARGARARGRALLGTRGPALVQQRGPRGAPRGLGGEPLGPRSAPRARRRSAMPGGPDEPSLLVFLSASSCTRHRFTSPGLAGVALKTCALLPVPPRGGHPSAMARCDRSDPDVRPESPWSVRVFGVALVVAGYPWPRSSCRGSERMLFYRAASGGVWSNGRRRSRPHGWLPWSYGWLRRPYGRPRRPFGGSALTPWGGSAEPASGSAEPVGARPRARRRRHGHGAGWEVGTRYVQHESLLGAICDIVAELRIAQRLAPSLAQMCEDPPQPSCARREREHFRRGGARAHSCQVGC